METIIQKLPSIDKTIFVLIFFFIIGFGLFVVTKRLTKNTIGTFIFGLILILADLCLFRSYYFIGAGILLIAGSLFQKREWR